jgi:hypothetical protein
MDDGKIMAASDGDKQEFRTYHEYHKAVHGEPRESDQSQDRAKATASRIVADARRLGLVDKRQAGTPVGSLFAS